MLVLTLSARALRLLAQDLQRLAFNSQQFARRFLCTRARMLYFREMLRRYKSLFFEDGRNHMQVTQAALHLKVH
jgi:hypothetical protein